MEPPVADGVRVLFRVESEGRRGRARFRMAAALRPPSGARLEFLGPVGGTRLVVATEDERAVALLPSERRFDTTESTAAAMDRLLGLPLDGARLVALLSGLPDCGGALAARSPGQLTPPTGHSGDSIVCPGGDIVFTGVDETPDGLPRNASLRDPTSGAIIAEVRYGDRLALPGGRWPRDIKFEVPREQAVISLTALEGPAAARLPDDLFHPTIPKGFERGPIFRGDDDPALFGTARDPGR